MILNKSLRLKTNSAYRILSMCMLLLVCSPCLYAQKATEIFIPIGKSPGLSHQYTYLGKIERVDKENQTIRADNRNIKVNSETKIWLDRSSINLPNRLGKFDDLRSGNDVEIKYVDSDKKKTAEWIKVKMTRP